MKNLTVATIALSAIAASLQTPAAASPPAPGPRGRLCHYTPLHVGAGVKTAVIDAGPMIADPAGTLHCIIRVNVNSHAGGGVAAHVACAADSNGMILCSDTVTYWSGPDDQDYLCTSYQKPNGTWLYWQPSDDKGTLDPTDDEAGHWTSNSNRPCDPISQFSTDPTFDLIDALTCPALFAHHGWGPGGMYYIDAEGDVFVGSNGNGIFEADWQNDLVWDCPLYTFDDGNPDQAVGGVIDW